MKMVRNKKISLLPKIKRTETYTFLFYEERGLKCYLQTPLSLKNEAWTEVFKRHLSLFYFSLLTCYQPHYHPIGSLSWLLMEKNPIWWTWVWSKITRTCDLSLHYCMTKSGVESSSTIESLSTLYSSTNQPSSIRCTSPLDYPQQRVTLSTTT